VPGSPPVPSSLRTPRRLPGPGVPSLNHAAIPAAEARRAGMTLIVLVLVWIPGMWLSWQNLTSRTAGRQSPDELELLETTLRPHLENTQWAIYLSDHPNPRAVSREFYRAQYAVAPTVLKLARNSRRAWKLLEDERLGRVVVIYRKPGFIESLRREALQRGHRLMVLAPGVALIRESETHGP